jgi:hypothetical protein
MGLSLNPYLQTFKRHADAAGVRYPQRRCSARTIPPERGYVLHPDTKKIAVDFETGQQMRPVSNLRPASTCGCGGETLADIPYQSPGGFVRFTTICVVCDFGYATPRFGGLRPPEFA